MRIYYSLNIADMPVSLNEKASNLVAPSKLYGHLAASTPVGAIYPHLYRWLILISLGKHL